VSESDKETSFALKLAFVTIVCMCTAIVLAIVIPNMIRVRSSVNPVGVCRNNLRQFDAAKQEWALESGKTNGTVATENDIKPYVKLDSNGNLPKCPQGGTYTIGRVGENVMCSFHGDLLGTNSP